MNTTVILFFLSWINTRAINEYLDSATDPHIKSLQSLNFHYCFQPVLVLIKYFIFIKLVILHMTFDSDPSSKL